MDNLRRLRSERGWSQYQLAEQSGVARATIQRIERGRVVPTKETANALAAAFDVSPEDIRARAGLYAAVSTLMEITHEREATTADLRALPVPMRTLFTRNCAARAELMSANAAVKKAGENMAAIEALGVAADQQSVAFTLCVRNLHSTEARKRFADATNTLSARLTGMAEAVAAAGHTSRRSMAALAQFSVAGFAISRLLMRFVCAARSASRILSGGHAA